jgi:hypothetical protein
MANKRKAGDAFDLDEGDFTGKDPGAGQTLDWRAEASRALSDWTVELKQNTAGDSGGATIKTYKLHRLRRAFLDIFPHHVSRKHARAAIGHVGARCAVPVQPSCVRAISRLHVPQQGYRGERHEG